MAHIHISGYSHIELIVQGQHSVLLKAHEDSLDREVLIKMLLPEFQQNSSLINQLKQEAHVLASLAHPHIVGLHELLEGPIGHCLVMPSYPQTLHQKIQSGPLPVLVVADLLEQLAAAVGTLHLNDIIHGNITPDNIWLDEADNVYLGYPLLEQSWCIDAEFFKSPDALRQAYTAPELAVDNPATVAADVFSLGIVCLECLSGSTDETSLHKGMDVDTSGLVYRLSRDIREVLRTATLPESDQRYASARRFADSFRAALPDTRRSRTQPLADPLTDRELEILEMMVSGLRDTEIAHKLGIQASTVGWHIRANIYRKLDVKSRRRAIERGLELELASSNRSQTFEARHNSEHTKNVMETGNVENPYKGLQPFAETDEAVFFGRTDLIDDLLERLEAGVQFIALVGPSGSGKSSVLQAGLIPALRRAVVRHSERWLVVSMVPKFHPLDELAISLTNKTHKPMPGLVASLSNNSEGLKDASLQILPTSEQSELILIIDQFEDIFTLVEDENIRYQFIANLITAVNDPRSRVRVIIALRADFYHRLLVYPALAQLLNANTSIVVPPTPEQLELAITGPANYVGLKIDPQLIARMIMDIHNQPSPLPLLQYTLMELYETREQNQLTLDAYKKIGGVVQTLSRRADDLMDELTPTEQAAAQQIFLRMVAFNDESQYTLRRVTIQELRSVVTNAGALDAVLNLFGRYRLLTFDQDASLETASVQITHEALIRYWQRLQNWIADYMEDLHVQQQLLHDSTEWMNEEQSTDFLATGTKLARYEALLESSLLLSQQEQDYLTKSKTKRDQEAKISRQQEAEKARLSRRSLQAWRITGIVLIAALISVLIMLGFAVHGQNEATAQARVALSHQLAAQALAEFQNPIGNDEYTTLLALRSLSHDYSAAADEALIRAVDRLPLRLLADTGSMVTALAYAPDGLSVFMGSIDGSVRQLDSLSGKVLQTFEGHTDEIWRIAVSPDGQYLLSGSSDHTAILWDTVTGQPIQSFTHDNNIRSVDFSPNGDTMLTVGQDAIARVWSRTSGQALLTITNGNTSFTSGTYSRDGQSIFLGDADGTAVQWSIDTQEPIMTFDGHSSSVYTMAISPDSDYLLTGGLDDTAIIWNIATGQIIQKLTAHTSSVRGVAFSPDNQYALTSSADRTARVWQVSDGAEVERYRSHLGRVRAITVSPTGDYFATGSEDGTVKLWWGPGYHSPTSLVGHQGEIYGVAFSPDGTRIITTGADATARLWDAESGQNLQVFTGHEGIVTSAAISPDGRFLVTGGLDSTARLWDLTTDQEIRQFTEHGDSIWSVKFSPDGQSILTASYDGRVRLWSVTTGELLQTFTGSDNGILAVAFSPNGRLIAAAGEDWLARIWDADTGQLVQTLTGHTDEIGNITFSPDGQYLLTGSRDSTARIWDTSTGKSIGILEGHTNTINGIAFSPDGQYIVTTSADRSARVWHTSDRRLLREYHGHTSGLWHVDISPDNQLAVTAGLDGIARIWPLDYGIFIEQVCQTLVRDLTDRERELAFIVDDSSTCPQASE